ncbi:MAG: amidohydrolase family protein [Blastocatellia bacterium]|nr:amidohydrolase family protein [Blastocatellia bacterium]
MIRMTAIVLAGGLLIAPVLGAMGGQSSGATEIAFVHVNVIPMTSERILEDHTVIVRGDRIVEVGPSARVKIPEGAIRIEGRGYYLLPGLGEMHGHIPPPQAPPEYLEAVLFLYLSNGITTVRGMLGAPGQLELRERANRGELLSPTLYLAGPSFSDASINSPEEAIARVREQKQQGWDLLKIHPGLTLEEYEAMARTAREVGMRWVGHVPAAVGLVRALEMGQETIDHLDGYIEYLEGDTGPLDRTKLEDIVRRTREAGAWVVPTMALWEVLIGARPLEVLLAYSELRYMPPQMVENWTRAHRARLENPNYSRERAERIAANRKEILRALHRGGVRILFGTDAPQQFSVPGFSLHREIPILLECGLTPYEILQTATRNVGEYFRHKDRFGTIEVGARADLILVKGNPLANLENLKQLAGVMVRGRWLSEKEIQERLEHIAARYRPTAK